MTVRLNGHLQTLAKYLEWNGDHRDAIFDWLQSYQAILASRFHSLASDPEISQALRNGFSLLGEHGQVRFLKDPEVARRLLECPARSHSVTAPALAELLARHLSQNAADMGMEPLKIPSYGLRDDDPVAVLTELDTHSDFSVPWISDDVTSINQIPPEVLPIVLRKIRSALELLGQGCTPSLVFFRSLTIRLAVRSEPARPRSFSSCSFGKFPGLTLMINVENNKIDEYKLADALVHESIHACIFIIESLGQPLVKEPFPPDIKLRSPWTGNHLFIDQYAEACFVWWGLANLWRRFSETSQLNASRVAELLEMARRGFIEDPIHSLLSGAAGQWITDEGRSGLLAVRELARNFG